jgi:hypothetical protein
MSQRGRGAELTVESSVHGTSVQYHFFEILSQTDDSELQRTGGAARYSEIVASRMLDVLWRLPVHY